MVTEASADLAQALKPPVAVSNSQSGSASMAPPLTTAWLRRDAPLGSVSASFARQVMSGRKAPPSMSPPTCGVTSV